MAALLACPQLLAAGSTSAPSRPRASRRHSCPVAGVVAGLRPSARLGGMRVTRHCQLCSRGTSVIVAATAGDAPQQLASPAVELPKRRIAVFVEPSPFSHTSGMKNRFLNMIANLQEQGDEVLVFTPDRNPPAEYKGAKVVGVAGLPLPFYKSDTLLLSFGLSLRIHDLLREWKPDVIHVACPGLMVFSALLYSRLLDTPLVASYHTHVPEYIKSYTWRGLAEPMWALIRTWTRLSNTMLVTSAVMQGELAKHACRARHLALWRRGVDVDIFNPGFRSAAMRATLSGGHPEDPLLVCVGRLGAEKNLAILRDVLAANPGARLALVGDGPQRPQLEAHFEGTPTVFTGMLSGTALSAAYASADIFVMPSETETLGFVVLEAMASGVPVVAVAAGGIPDIITTPGTSGLLYPPGDVAAASEAVRRLIQDKQLAAAVGEAGRQDVSRFGWPAASRHLREVLYSQAIRRARAIRRFRRLAARVTQQRVAAAALLSLLSSQRVYHAAAALACGALVAAVASTAPMGAMTAMAALPLEVPAGAAYLALVIAAGGALPLVPFQPLALLAGYSFGAAHGALIVAVGVLGASIASATCFRLFNGGHLLREHLPLGRVRPFLAHQLRAVAAAVQRGSFSRGTAAVAALRLRPLAPFSLSSYLTLDAGIKPIAFVTGTVLGMAPHCALYAAAGAAWRLHVASGRPVVRLLSSALDALQQQHVLAVQAAAALLVFATVQALWTIADEHMRAASRREAAL